MIEILQDLKDRIDDLEEAQGRMLRWGAVSSVDPDAATVTVEYPSGLVSAPMPCALMGSRLHLPPAVGEQCMVLAPHGDSAAALAIVGVGNRNDGAGDADVIEGALAHDRATGEVGVGASPTDYVALAALVDAELTKITTTLGTGSNGAGAVVWGTPYVKASVAASKVKAE